MRKVILLLTAEIVVSKISLCGSSSIASMQRLASLNTMLLNHGQGFHPRSMVQVGEKCLTGSRLNDLSTVKQLRILSLRPCPVFLEDFDIVR